MTRTDPRRATGARVTSLGRYPIKSPVDAFSARRGVRTHAAAVGFQRLQCEELAVVASELCTNIVKYGARGALVVERLEHPSHGPGVVLDAQDEGPPFRDFQKAIRDGSDDRGTIPPEAMFARRGIGAGLGAVRRLTHMLWVEDARGGKHVLALRYVNVPLPV